MPLISMEKALPAIPAKRYFTIGEVSELCGVKPYVLRYWEQEFTQLKPMKRRGNRRYYQHHEVLLIRRIRDLLYEQGFTISGARNRLSESSHGQRAETVPAAKDDVPQQAVVADVEPALNGAASSVVASDTGAAARTAAPAITSDQLRQELLSIRGLLGP
jgi:DNA-binding transcriptional MerR regulator